MSVSTTAVLKQRGAFTDRVRSGDSGREDEVLARRPQDLVEIWESEIGRGQLPAHFGQAGDALELRFLRHVEGVTGRKLGVHVDFVVDEKVDLRGVETVQFGPDIGQSLEGFQSLIGGLFEVLGHGGFGLKPFGRQRLVELRCVVG